MNRDEALTRLRPHSTEIKRFESLGLFGSVARNEAGPESDLDLVVEFDGPPTYDRYIGLKMLLEDALGCPALTLSLPAPSSRACASTSSGDTVRVA